MPRNQEPPLITLVGPFLFLIVLGCFLLASIQGGCQETLTQPMPRFRFIESPEEFRERTR